MQILFFQLIYIRYVDLLPILLEIREEEKLIEPTYLFLVQNGAKKDFNKIFNSLIIWLNNQEQGTLFQIL